MKALTIEELKALPFGEWVWVVDKETPLHTGYYQIHGFAKTHIHFNRETCIWVAPNALYGKDWLVYKNKEFAESKDEWVKLPCSVGDTMYWVYSCDQKEPISFIAENISGKILDDGEWRFFAFNRYGYGGACGVIDGRWYLGKDKAEAEQRLRELQKDK